MATLPSREESGSVNVHADQLRVLQTCTGPLGAGNEGSIWPALLNPFLYVPALHVEAKAFYARFQWEGIPQCGEFLGHVRIACHDSDADAVVTAATTTVTQDGHAVARSFVRYASVGPSVPTTSSLAPYAAASSATRVAWSGGRVVTDREIRTFLVTMAEIAGRQETRCVKSPQMVPSYYLACEAARRVASDSGGFDLSITRRPYAGALWRWEAADKGRHASDVVCAVDYKGTFASASSVDAALEMRRAGARPLAIGA